MTATGRVETLGGGPSCRIAGEGLSPAKSCPSLLHSTRLELNLVDPSERL